MARGLRGFWSDSLRGRVVALKHGSQLTGRQLSRELALDSAEWFEAAWSELVEQLIGIWKKYEEVIQFTSIYNTNFNLLGWCKFEVRLCLKPPGSWKTIKSPSPARNASYTKLMTAGAAHGPGIYLATELGRWMLVKGTTLWEQQYGKNRYIQRWFIKKRKV